MPSHRAGQIRLDCMVRRESCIRPGAGSLVRIVRGEPCGHPRFVEGNREVPFKSFAVRWLEDHLLASAVVKPPQSNATPRLHEDICFLPFKKVSNVDGTEGIVRYCDDFVVSNRLSRHCKQVIGRSVSKHRSHLMAKMRGANAIYGQTGGPGALHVCEPGSCHLRPGGIAISRRSSLGGVPNRIPGLKGGRGIEIALRSSHP